MASTRHLFSVVFKELNASNAGLNCWFSDILATSINCAKASSQFLNLSGFNFEAIESDGAVAVVTRDSVVGGNCIRLWDRCVERCD